MGISRLPTRCISFRGIPLLPGISIRQPTQSDCLSRGAGCAGLKSARPVFIAALLYHLSIYWSSDNGIIIGSISPASFNFSGNGRSLYSRLVTDNGISNYSDLLQFVYNCLLRTRVFLSYSGDRSGSGSFLQYLLCFCLKRIKTRRTGSFLSNGMGSRELLAYTSSNLSDCLNLGVFNISSYIAGLELANYLLLRSKLEWRFKHCISIHPSLML